MYQGFFTSIGMVVCLAFMLADAAFSAPNASSDFNNPLSNTSWQLVEFQSMDDSIGTVRPEDPAHYTMKLDDGGTVEMRLNCNSARGRWSVDPSGEGGSGRFEFGPLAITQAICPPPSMDERIAADTQYIRGYLVKNDKLYLSLMADAGIYVWEREQREARLAGHPAAPEDGGPRYWEVVGVSGGLNLREQPSTFSRKLAAFAQGTILDNLGCEASEGRFWCYVQPFGGGPTGYVAAEFLKPALSPNGMVMTGPDDSALLAGQGIFDASGTIPCAQYRGQPMTQCEFGVARAGGGDATVVVKKADTGQRAIFFRMGKPAGADISEADGDPEFSVSKENDLHLIRIGNERYEIPEAVIFAD
jgi:heat shock protein HslJ